MIYIKVCTEDDGWVSLLLNEKQIKKICHGNKYSSIEMIDGSLLHLKDIGKIQKLKDEFNWNWL